MANKESPLGGRRIAGTNKYQMNDGRIVQLGPAGHSSGEVGRNGANKLLIVTLGAIVTSVAGWLTWLYYNEENGGVESGTGLTGGGGDTNSQSSLDGLVPQIQGQGERQSSLSGVEQLIIPSEYKRISSLSLDPHFVTYEANMNGTRNIVHIFNLSDQMRLKILAGKKRDNRGGGDVLSFHSLQAYADELKESQMGTPVFLFNAAPYILSDAPERKPFNQALSYPLGVYDKDGVYHEYAGFEKLEGDCGADDRKLLVNYGTAVEFKPYQDGGSSNEYITLETQEAEREGQKKLARTLVATGDSGRQLLVYVSTGRTKDKAFQDVRAFRAAPHNIVMAGGGRDTQSLFAPNNEYIVESPDDRLLPNALALYVPQ